VGFQHVAHLSDARSGATTPDRGCCKIFYCDRNYTPKGGLCQVWFLPDGVSTLVETHPALSLRAAAKHSHKYSRWQPPAMCAGIARASCVRPSLPLLAMTGEP